MLSRGPTWTGPPIATCAASTSTAVESGSYVMRRRPGNWPSRWMHRVRSWRWLLGAWWRLLAPSHDWWSLLVAVVHWWRELFSRLRAGPDATSVGLLATPLSQRASSTTLAWHVWGSCLIVTRGNTSFYWTSANCLINPQREPVCGEESE